MGAPNLRYGDIIEVIDAAKGAGVEKVGIVTEGMRRAAGAGARDSTPSIDRRIKQGPPTGGPLCCTAARDGFATRLR